LVDQFGAVLKVANTEELRNSSRGITLEGVASGGRTMFPLKDVTNVFGQKSRQAALERVTRELGTAEEDAENWALVKTFLEGIKGALQGLKQPHFDSNPLREAGNIIEKTREALAMWRAVDAINTRRAFGSAVYETPVNLCVARSKIATAGLSLRCREM
jgi:hypothetical protein